MTDRTQNKKDRLSKLRGFCVLFFFFFFFILPSLCRPVGSPGLSGESGLRREGRETGGWGDSSRHQVAPLDYRAAAESAEPCRADLLSSPAAFWQR